MQTLTKKQLIELLKITPKRLEKLLEAGAPQGKKKNAYDPEEFCRWIVARKKSKTDKSNMRDLAQVFLSGKNPAAPAKKATNKKPAVKQTKQEPGLVAALDRARAAELAAYENHLSIQQQQGIISASALDAWQKTLDILRKCEKDFTDVLKTRKELVETAKVQEWLESNIEQTKTILLNLPAKLAPSLESLPWHEIQKRLTQEIRDAISKLENFS